MSVTPRNISMICLAALSRHVCRAHSCVLWLGRPSGHSPIRSIGSIALTTSISEISAAGRDSL